MLETSTLAATTTPSCSTRLYQHMFGLLLCPLKSTVSNFICTRGGQHADWTADYRLYSKDRVDESVLFGRARDTLIENLAPGKPLVVALDDTINLKTGKKIHGSAWKRDPLGPPFQTNLVLAQRFLQFSAAWPLENGDARMVPIDFPHAPTPAKPSKTATPEECKSYREALRQHNLNRQTLERLKILVRDIPASRQLIILQPTPARRHRGRLCHALDCDIAGACRRNGVPRPAAAQMAQGSRAQWKPAVHRRAFAAAAL